MGVWHDLKVGEFKLRYTILANESDDEGTDYPNVDSEGKSLSWIKGTATRGYFVDDKNEKVDKVFKKINDRIVNEIPRTTEVKQFVEVKQEEAFDLKPKMWYFIENEQLAKELSENGKALRFRFKPTNHPKEPYRAYIYNHPLYNSLIMVCGYKYLSEKILDIKDNIEQYKALKEVELANKEIKKADVDELFTA